MTNTREAAARARNLARTAFQRWEAEVLGFAPAPGRDDWLRHASGRLDLVLVDDECTWRLRLLDTRGVETGAVDMSNLTVEQFRAVLSGLVSVP